MATDSPSNSADELSRNAAITVTVTSNDIVSTLFQYGLASNQITRENATSYQVPISFLLADKGAVLHASFDTARGVGEIELTPATETPIGFDYLLLQDELYHEDRLLTVVLRARDSRYYHRNTGELFSNTYMHKLIRPIKLSIL